jgi:methylated-DNA-protein-cysteine methyltransferase-like protein
LRHAKSPPSAELILAGIRAIPAGFVRTYGDLSPVAPRFAGWVLKGTREDVPWWRVVRADGTLPVGEPQRARLDAEGVPLLAGDPPRVDMRRARLPAPPPGGAPADATASRRSA